MSLMTLFIYSGLAATLLPGGSEVLLIAMLLDMPDKAVLLWAVATLGNTLGAYVTLLMGAFAAQKIGLKGWQVAPESCQSVWGKIKNRIKSAFTLSDAQLKQSQKYGMVLLLLSWVPVIGDAFCLAAGLLRWPIKRCLLLILLGKALRYAIVLALVI